MNKQLIFIDDSGDPGFTYASSANFLMASAVFIDADIAARVNDVMNNYKKSLGWSEETEFKFTSTNKRIIKELLKQVAEYDFEIYSIYIDKTEYKTLLPIIDKSKLYNWAIKELLGIIPLGNAYVKMDGHFGQRYRMRLSSYLRQEIKKKGMRIKQFKLEDSKKDNLIQLADLIAGAINRSLKPEKTDSKDYVAILKNRIVKIEGVKIR